MFNILSVHIIKNSIIKHSEAVKKGMMTKEEKQDMKLKKSCSCAAAPVHDILYISSS